MEAIRLFKILNREQRNTFVACFLGWALDALDFFLVTFVLVPIGHDFGESIPKVAFAITLTLMMRPLGAFMVGTMCRKTCVPRSAATSPPFSIFWGGSPVYAG